MADVPNRYLQPQRYLDRLRSLTASFAKPVTDYESETLIELVYQKTVAFNQATALDLKMGSERLLLAVATVLAERPRSGPCRVLDFGGACGIHHTLAKLMFSDTEFRWAVVETGPMVRKARAFETDSLRFFEDIKSATSWLESVDLANNNSALQYVDDPLKTVTETLELAPHVALWERLMLSDGPTHVAEQRTMLFQHGPGDVPKGFKNRPVRHRVTKLSRADFLAAQEPHYRMRCSVVEFGYQSTYLFSRRD